MNEFLNLERKLVQVDPRFWEHADQIPIEKLSRPQDERNYWGVIDAPHERALLFRFPSDPRESRPSYVYVRTLEVTREQKHYSFFVLLPCSIISPPSVEYFLSFFETDENWAGSFTTWSKHHETLYAFFKAPVLRMAFIGAFDQEIVIARAARSDVVQMSFMVDRNLQLHWVHKNRLAECEQAMEGK